MDTGMKRIALTLLALLLATVRADQTISTPTTYTTPSSLTISSGVPLLGTWDLSGATVTLPAGVIPVTSVFGRIGAITATAGDYTAAQVTNAVSTAGSYANPSWLSSLAWGKITGAPAFITGNQTITLSGDATGAGTTSITTTVAAKMPVGGAAGQVLTKNSATNYDASWLAPAAASVKGTANVAIGSFATALPSGVHAGAGAAGGQITLSATSSGKVLMMASGSATCATAGNSWQIYLRYGTGTPPATGAATTGTSAGVTQWQITSGNARTPWAIQGVVTGLTPGTQYWFDIVLVAASSVLITSPGSILTVVEL
jgi:hypothetical protein